MDTLPITTPRQAGIYVRQARETQGLTRAVLAKKAGVSNLPIANSNALPKPSVGRRPARQGTPSSYGALLAQIVAEQGLAGTSDLSFGCKVVK